MMDKYIEREAALSVIRKLNTPAKSPAQKDMLRTASVYIQAIRPHRDGGAWEVWTLQELTHLSLFSGIGGLDLAAEWAGFRTVGQCEWADYPRAVLRKHWPGIPMWKDVRDLTGDEFREKTGIERPTVVSGGFPCQPHSFAGKRLASYDARDLWGELFRVFRETGARWLVGENVPGLLSSEYGRFFGRVLRDLAEAGCHVWWYCFPAYAAGATAMSLHRLLTASVYIMKAKA